MISVPFPGAAGDGRATQQVSVPLVTQTDIVRAYHRNRAQGLRVTIRNTFSVEALCSPIAQKQSPRAGERVPLGSVVEISTGSCPIGSPAVAKPMPAATVPSFKGRSAWDAVTWAKRRTLFWAMRGALPITAADAPRFFDNYRVTSQRPAPGARMRQGVFVRSGGTTGFRPTPLRLRVSARS